MKTFFCHELWDKVENVRHNEGKVILLTKYVLSIPPTSSIIHQEKLAFSPPSFPIDGVCFRYDITRLVYYCPYTNTNILTIYAERHPEIPLYTNYRALDFILSPNWDLCWQAFPMTRKNWGKVIVSYLLWLYKQGLHQEASIIAEKFERWNNLPAWMIEREK